MLPIVTAGTLAPSFGTGLLASFAIGMGADGIARIANGEGGRRDTGEKKKCKNLTHGMFPK